MFSNVASLLVLGSGRFIVDKVWGITVFGAISFAILMTNFFLTFIGQISMVLFPALRQTDEIGLRKFYYISRDVLGIILAGFLLAYMPLNYILSLWLPQYKESLYYLALLLPLCTYEGKMNLLCTTYFKVLRKERLLLNINLVSLVISIIMSLIGAYVFKNIYIVVIAMVLAVAIRSIISEIYLARFMEANIIKDIFVESILVVVYITCTWYISPVFGFVLYLGAYLLYLLFSRAKLINILKIILKNLNKSIDFKLT
ncbi:hypothetical protein [Bacillus cereus]|uniref:hypothetical protein n=1 Tax=Bacillus cereus TaxID=1396 RepID=UPI001F334469|nr:hypothetical protein [Bacillus cereus]